MQHWSLATTFPLYEFKAREQLERCAFVCYLPTTLVSQRKTERKMALFPGYIFFQVNENWQKIFHASLFCVQDILMSNEKPLVVPNCVIDEIKSRENSDGIIKVEKSPIDYKFKRNQPIRVKEGRFQSYHGLFDDYTGDLTVRVLLEMMGRAVRVNLRADELSDEIRDERFMSRAYRKRLLNKQRRLSHPTLLNA